MPNCPVCNDTGIVVVLFRYGTEYSPCRCEAGKGKAREFVYEEDE